MPLGKTTGKEKFYKPSEEGEEKAKI